MEKSKNIKSNKEIMTLVVKNETQINKLINENVIIKDRLYSTLFFSATFIYLITLKIYDASPIYVIGYLIVVPIYILVQYKNWKKRL